MTTKTTISSNDGTPVTVQMLRDLHPERFCRSTIRRGRYEWVCYQPRGHTGPHNGGNSNNDPVYRSWFDVIDGGAGGDEDG
jgi:hypothetical protein